MADQSSTSEDTSNLYLTDQPRGRFYGVFLWPTLPLSAHSSYQQLPDGSYFPALTTEDHNQFVLNQNTCKTHAMWSLTRRSSQSHTINKNEFQWVQEQPSFFLSIHKTQSDLGFSGHTVDEYPYLLNTNNGGGERTHMLLHEPFTHLFIYVCLIKLS